MTSLKCNIITLLDYKEIFYIKISKDRYWSKADIYDLVLPLDKNGAEGAVTSLYKHLNIRFYSDSRIEQNDRSSLK